MDDEDVKHPNDGKVGYRHPPEHTRFKPGKSGNPRGRPRNDVRPITRRQMRNDLLAIMEEEIIVQVNGVPKKMSLILAVFRQALIKSAAGQGKLTLEHLQLWRELLGEHEKENPNTVGFLAAIEGDMAAMDPKELTPELRRLLTNLRRKSRRL